jgi:hypothetical protein
MTLAPFRFYFGIPEFPGTNSAASVEANEANRNLPPVISFLFMETGDTTVSDLYDPRKKKFVDFLQPLFLNALYCNTRVYPIVSGLSR